MSRHAAPDIVSRTIRVHLPTYQAIMHFFSNSPSGVTGTAAIRELLIQFGTYCEEQSAKGRQANINDLAEIGKIVRKFLGEAPAENEQ